MFSNIPINLLSETQLGGCTALSCVLGRRREARGRAELTFVPTRKGMTEPAVCAHKPSNTHAHTHTHSDTNWLDVAVQHVSSLVGLCVDFGIVRVGTALVPKWPAVFMCLSNGGEPLQNPLDTCVTSRLSYCRGPLSSVCVFTHTSKICRVHFLSFVYFECVAIRRLFFFRS